MSVLSTMHSHNTFCDGKNTPKEMAQRASDLGFVSFGFSSHSHLPYDNCYTMTPKNEKNYRKEILKLKEEYKEKMDILLGLELDLDSPTPDFKYDFIIGSVHQLHINGKIFAVDESKNSFKECIEEFNGVENLIKEYYTQVLRCSLRDGVDIVGHFDLIEKFNEDDSLFDSNNEKYLEIAFDTIDQILKKRPNIVFEVNTGAIGRGYRSTPYPQLPILKYLAKSGAKIMINSDTHNIDTIDAGYNTAIKICNSAGFKEIYRLRKFGFEKIEI